MNAPKRRPPEPAADRSSGGRGISWIRSTTRPATTARFSAALRTGISWIRSAAVLLTGSALTAMVVVTGSAAPAWAVDSLQQVIENLRDVIVGLLVGLATLFATIGGVRYMLAGGDPSEVEAAKKTLKYAAVGYAVAVLAPVLVKLLQQVVGAP